MIKYCFKLILGNGPLLATFCAIVLISGFAVYSIVGRAYSEFRTNIAEGITNSSYFVVFSSPKAFKTATTEVNSLNHDIFNCLYFLDDEFSVVASDTVVIHGTVSGKNVSSEGSFPVAVLPAIRRDEARLYDTILFGGEEFTVVGFSLSDSSYTELNYAAVPEGARVFGLLITPNAVPTKGALRQYDTALSALYPGEIQSSPEIISPSALVGYPLTVVRVIVLLLVFCCYYYCIALTFGKGYRSIEIIYALGYPKSRYAPLYTLAVILLMLPLLLLGAGLSAGVLSITIGFLPFRVFAYSYIFTAAFATVLCSLRALQSFPRGRRAHV